MPHPHPIQQCGDAEESLWSSLPSCLGPPAQSREAALAIVPSDAHTGLYGELRSVSFPAHASCWLCCYFYALYGSLCHMREDGSLWRPVMGLLTQTADLYLQTPSCPAPHPRLWGAPALTNAFLAMRAPRSQPELCS